MAIDQESAFTFQTLVVSSTAVSITATVGDNRGHRAVITCEGAALRFRYDGTAPTATVGHILSPGDRLILEGRANISNFKAIRKDSSDSTLQITLETI